MNIVTIYVPKMRIEMIIKEEIYFSKAITFNSYNKKVNHSFTNVNVHFDFILYTLHLFIFIISNSSIIVSHNVRHLDACFMIYFLEPKKTLDIISAFMLLLGDTVEPIIIKNCASLIIIIIIIDSKHSDVTGFWGLLILICQNAEYKLKLAY